LILGGAIPYAGFSGHVFPGHRHEAKAIASSRLLEVRAIFFWDVVLFLVFWACFCGQFSQTLVWFSAFWCP